VSEERFIRIETKIDVLQADVKQLKHDVKELRKDVDWLKVEVKELRVDVDWLKVELKEVKVEIKELKADFYSFRVETNRRLDRLEINQELMRDDIKHLAEGQAGIVEQIARGFAEMRQYIDERLVPLEVAVRELHRKR